MASNQRGYSFRFCGGTADSLKKKELRADLRLNLNLAKAFDTADRKTVEINGKFLMSRVLLQDGSPVPVVG
jgi:hypothetical protein